MINNKITKNLKQLPIGIYTFNRIIENNYLYVDKTDLLHDIISNFKYVFLSRPRRFGKSLVLSTLENIFKAKKDLFKGLKIEKLYDFKEEYPVISLDMPMSKTLDVAGLKDGLKNILIDNANKLGVKLDSSLSYVRMFHVLINKTKETFNKQVVVLIDEYDKPILDKITDLKERDIFRNILADFYTVLKQNDANLKFVFLTGVTKFSKISVFSGLNNIEDISLSPKYATVCGYTQNEIETTLNPYLDGVDLEKLKRWYNGYNFLGDTVYNPYGIFLFISEDKVFANYWSSTGTPTFLIRLIQGNDYYIPNLESIEVQDSDTGSFDIDKIKIEILLLQAGYLTIKAVKPRPFGASYVLGFPNLEVKMSFTDNILDYSVENRIEKKLKLLDILSEGKVEDLEQNIRTLFNSLSYENYRNNDIEKYEGHYAGIIYAYFASLGVELISEDHTNKGRIDLTLKYQDKVYIFEFKVNSKESAIKQIYDREYFKKYQDGKNQIFLIGINFDAKKREIKDFEVKEL